MFNIRQRKVVNIITMVSLSGVLFGTMAMVVVLSVFNGFDSIIQDLYKKVDTDFMLQSKEENLFHVDNQFINTINSIDGIQTCSEILEYKMLAEYDDHQLVIKAKGVDKNYLTVSNLHKHLILGNYLDGTQNFTIVGNGIFNKMSLKLLDFEKPLRLSFFTGSKTLDLNSAVQSRSFYVSGVFNTQVEFDNTHIVLSIHDLRDFLSFSRLCSSIEIRIKDSVNYKHVEEALRTKFANTFVIKNRDEQRPFVYKMVRTEKLAVYLIFSFILIISMLSLIASLVVLLMEKQSDIAVLHVLGLGLRKIQNIFLLIGFFITFLGGLLGGLSGLFFCLLQDKFQLIKLGQKSFFIEAYPIKVDYVDLVIIQLIVCTLGFITSYIVSRNKKLYNY